MVNSTRSKIKPLKIVLYSVLGAILLFVFIVLGTLLVEKYVKKSPVPMFAGYGYLIVETGSMSSTINKGDLIIVKKTDEYKVFDIVTFVNSRGEVVTHRIVGEKDGLFVTRGDYNLTDDEEKISADQICAVWVSTIPKVGLVFDWILHDGGIIYLIAILAVVIAGAYFLSLTKDPEAEADKPAPTAEDTAQPDEDSSQDKN